MNNFDNNLPLRVDFTAAGELAALRKEKIGVVDNSSVHFFKLVGKARLAEGSF